MNETLETIILIAIYLLIGWPIIYKALRNVLRGELRLSYTLLKSLKWRENAILLNGSPAHVNAAAADVASIDVACIKVEEAQELVKAPSGKIRLVVSCQ